MPTVADLPNLRAFQDEKGYVVDVVTSKAKPADLSQLPAGLQQSAVPDTAPPAKPPSEGAASGADAPAAKSEMPIFNPKAAIAAQGARPPASIAAPVPQPTAPPSNPPAVAEAKAGV